MTRVTTRRVLFVAVLLVGSMIVPAAPGVAAEPPPPETVLESIDGLEERKAEQVEVPSAEDEPADAHVDAHGHAADTHDEPTDAHDEPGDASSEAEDEPADAPSEAQEQDPAVDEVRVSTSEPTETPIPFSMIAFKLPAGLDEVEFRTQGPDGWSPWEAIGLMDVDEGPDTGTDEANATDVHATEAAWVGEADAVQIRATEASTSDVEVHVIDSMGLNESFFAKTARYLRARPAPAEAVSRPPIVTREQWGANESWRSGSPHYIRPEYAVVHHTAGTNDYTRSESPGVVRGVYRWHTQGNGWSDIGYNLLIDRYGTIYEGRYGGVDRGVQGAHARGHNSDSFGVSLMGNFQAERPPKVAIDRLVDVISWKFDVHDIDADPSGKVTGAGSSNRTLATISGHRDVGSTTCPGGYIDQMDDIRDRVAVQVKSGDSWQALSGDWNGDGRATPGWFSNGRWYLRTASGSVTAFAYGSGGDVPITGDWNGDGRTGIGIVRDGRWHLRNSLSAGSAQVPAFTFGRVTQGDVPISGDWNGNGRDGIGIVRYGRWHLRNNLSGGTAELPVFTFGRVTDGDIPLTGDWNGNRRYGIGIVRDGRWHLRQTPSGGSADIDPFTFGRVSNGDLPVVGDWNGTGRHGIGIARGAEWHLRNSLSGGSAQEFYDFSS